MTSKRFLLAVLIAASTVLSGCSVKMARDEGALVAPSNGVVTTAQKAEGVDGKVGWGRITMFYIPVVPIFVEGDANELVMDQVRRALRASGHQIAVHPEGTSQSGLVVKAKVDDFWFNNYTWFFPLVPTWGSVKVAISVVDPRGNPVWTKSFDGSGITLNFFNGYTSASDQAWETLSTAMIAEFSSPAFKQLFADGALAAESPRLATAQSEAPKQSK